MRINTASVRDFAPLFYGHVRSLWGRYWLLPLLPAVYAGLLASAGHMRTGHLVAALVIPVFAFAGRTTKRLLVCSAPFLLIAWSYDAIQYPLAALTVPQRVAGCGLRNLELALFGVGPDTTLPDFFARHHAAFFDLLFAVPYGMFLYISAIYAGYLMYRDCQRMLLYTWSLALGYLLLYCVWFAFPSAPPWYIQAHGCTIDPHVASNAAGLLRVDRVLGMHYFERIYSHSTAVFGAMPSMHVAMPMIGMLAAWSAGSVLTRSVHGVYAGWMLAASVYLDHHWLLDGLAGWLLAAVSVAVTRRLLRLIDRKPDRAQSAPCDPPGRKAGAVA